LQLVSRFIFTPWVVSGTNAKGVPFLFIKVRSVFENRITPQLNDHTSEQAFSGSEEGRISISRAGFATAGLNLTGGLDPMEVDLVGICRHCSNCLLRKQTTMAVFTTSN